MNQAPCVTFREFRKVAKQHEWSVEWLVEQCRAALDRPTDTIRRVLEGARVEGHWAAGKWIAPHWDDMTEVVLPYRCLIALYQRATQPVPVLTGERACACGCGGKVAGRHKWASPGCRKRVQRRARTIAKVAV
jgi:hypothetical protein